MGAHGCVLQARIEGAWMTLAYDYFQVLEPPIRIDAAFGPGDRGRVLVLLDDAAGDACTGLTALGFESGFVTPPAADAQVSVELQGTDGWLLDSETTALDTRDINQQPGSGGVDLLIEDFSATHLKLTVEASDAGQLGAGYRLSAEVTQASDSLALDSGPVATDCTVPLQVDALLGDFRVTELAMIAANDPLGRNHTPDLLTQQHYLESLLRQAGWSFTLVTDKEAFARELRSGGYAVYLLLSEQINLDEQVQKELREAVFRGEGLVEAGGHDPRQGRIDEALGIHFIGKHAGMGGIAVHESPLHGAASASFALDDKQLRVETTGAVVLGEFLDGAGVAGGEPAVTDYGYGNGRSIYFGFDLLAEAALLEGADNLYAGLILDALATAHPQTLTPLAGGVYPLRISLSNEGIATPGRILLPLPADVEVIDAGGATVGADHGLTWLFDLAEAAMIGFESWLKLSADPLHLEARIQTGGDPDYVDYTALTLEIAPAPGVLVDDALNAVLALDDNQYKQVKKYLEWAQQDLLEQDYESALSALIRAADALIKIDTAQSDGIRLLVVEALRHVSQQI